MLDNRPAEHLLMASVNTSQASGQATAALQAKLPTYLKDAQAFVAEGLGADTEQQPRRQTLGELLLGLPPPQPTPSHLSDAGLVLDHPGLPAGSMHAMQQPAQAATEQPQQLEQPQQQQDGSAAEAEEQQDEESIAAMLQESLLQGTGGTNRAELEAMLIRWGVGASVGAVINGSCKVCLLGVCWAPAPGG